MKTREEEEEEEENASECSSGCQSGWTMYLDQSSDEEPESLPYYKAISDEEEDGDEDEDEEGEDLSMVSDASSGPPHFLEEDHEHYQNSSGKKRRVEADSSPFLDDTASSTFFSFPETSSAAHKATKEELSCGFSTTHFKRMPAFARHLGYSQSSTPAKTRSVCRGEGEKKLR